MAQVINTNIMSLNAQRRLETAQKVTSTSMQRLASGLRINSAKDDAAGLAISNRMTSQVRGLNQAMRNANDAISMSQTAEGALQESTAILQRVRELGIQSANDTNSSTDRKSLQAEVNQLKSELSRIAEATTFNGRKLLDGSLNNASFHIGSEANETINVSIKDMRATGLGNNTVSTSNTKSGIEVSTRNSQHLADGQLIGKAVVHATNELNGTAAQTLTVKDADGTTVGTAAALVNAQTSTTATALDAINGVSVTAYNQVKISNVTTASHNEAETLVIKGGGSANLTVTLAANTAYTAADSATAIQNAYNALDDAGKAALGFAITKDGNDIYATNSSGKDIVVVAGQTTTGRAVTSTVTGLDGTATTNNKLAGTAAVRAYTNTNAADAAGGWTLTAKNAGADGNTLSFQLDVEAGNGAFAITEASSGVFKVTVGAAAGETLADLQAWLEAGVGADEAETARLANFNNAITISAVTSQALDDAAKADMAANTLATGTDTAASKATTSGRMDVFMAEGYTIESTVADAAGSYFAVANATANTADAADVGIANVADSTNNMANFGNSVAAQELSLVGPDGSGTATIGQNADARTIASAVNAASSSTGITAKASTEAVLSGLTANGTVTFDLSGQNANAVSISASVKTDDLSALAAAINEQTGNTGITADLENDTSTLTLKNADGYDIKIQNFSHSAATTTTVSGSAVQTMDVTGGAGAAVKLSDGGFRTTNQHSTVVGGTVKFSASAEFQVSSSVAGTTGTGVNEAGVTKAGGSGLFAGALNAANTSTLKAVNEIDISTREGANEAIEIATAALSQIDEARGSLGAVQNRFESTISNLGSVSENVSAARSRVRDADFASETAELARGQILSQAGIAMLSQANSSQQSVLSLLQ